MTKKTPSLISSEFLESPATTEKVAAKETALEIVARLEKSLAGRKSANQQSPRPPTRVQIPLWSEDHRPVLHDLVRSALFTCGQRDARMDLKAKPICALEHIKITYTGEELRQRDYDVYLQILHLSRGATVDNRQEWVEFEARSLIKMLGWTQNSRSLVELRETIRRLTACALEVTRSRTKSSAPVVYGGPLLLKYAGAQEGGFDEVTFWKVQINSEVAAQLKPGDYTRIDWQIRTKLSPLEKWLHAFYSTNQHPYPMKVETIHKLCGSRMAEVKFFRRAIKAALDRLTEVGFLSSWELDETDKVRVVRSQMLTANADRVASDAGPLTQG
ncbi:plasmid replication initiator TrfA [Caballeronia sp. Lep1P3]|uniref:plasmid replication initiator TrfA n=1 Tax=Caballeronia sp. Lep1P3 TaxID=2878150 RepID=UPI001FCFA590|nr:plasmid replication initiator TrfA [Caballeronia sp. Lep1P3]